MKWLDFVKKYREDHPELSYKEAMKEAAPFYKKDDVKGGARGDAVKSARREYEYEISKPMSVRDPAIPAGKNTSKKGGAQGYTTAPPRPINDKYVGGVQVLANSELHETDEAIKGGTISNIQFSSPDDLEISKESKKGAGIISKGLHVLGDIGDIFGFGLKGGINPDDEAHTVRGGRNAHAVRGGVNVGDVLKTVGDVLEIFAFGKSKDEINKNIKILSKGVRIMKDKTKNM